MWILLLVPFVGLAALGLAVCLGSGVNAQDKGQKKDEKLTNVQGKVQSIDNKANTHVAAGMIVIIPTVSPIHKWRIAAEN